jgi:hypothetical protein
MAPGTFTGSIQKKVPGTIIGNPSRKKVPGTIVGNPSRKRCLAP